MPSTCAVFAKAGSIAAAPPAPGTGDQTSRKRADVLPESGQFLTRGQPGLAGQITPRRVASTIAPMIKALKYRTYPAVRLPASTCHPCPSLRNLTRANLSWRCTRYVPTQVAALNEQHAQCFGGGRGTI